METSHLFIGPLLRFTPISQLLLFSIITKTHGASVLRPMVGDLVTGIRQIDCHECFGQKNNHNIIIGYIL